MITYVSLAQGQALQSDTDRSQKKDLITVYINREKKALPPIAGAVLSLCFYQFNIQQTGREKHLY